jgi:hypothetical protein
MSPVWWRGAGLIALSAAAGLAVSIFNYFSRTSGIDGSGGALLVIASCAAILLAALLLALRSGIRDGLNITLLSLIFLGILGTALAAYLLASTWLQVLMALGLIGWLTTFLRSPPSHSNA